MAATSQRAILLPNGRVLRMDRSQWADQRSDLTRYLSSDGLVVIATVDDTPHGFLLHVSLTYPDHEPSFTDLRAIHSALFPGYVDAMVVFPAAATDSPHDLEPHTTHLWQVPALWCGACWSQEGGHSE